MAWKEWQNASSVYGKSAAAWVISINLFRGSGQEETGGSGDRDTVSSWLASPFISSPHGCLLINTSEKGASDPDDT